MLKELLKLLPLFTATRRGTRRTTTGSRRRGRRPAGIVGILVLIAALWTQWNKDSGATQKRTPGTPSAPGAAVAKIEQAGVGKVIDGDTLEARVSGRNVRVRLTGIDAMDSHNGEKRDEQADRHGLTADRVEDFSELAAAALRKATEGGRIDLVHESGSRQLDDFGRVLAYVEVEGRDIAEDLLSAGLAEARREPHPRSDHYRNLEKQARSARAGIWQNGR